MAHFDHPIARLDGTPTTLAEQGMVTRAAPRGELPEGIDERQVLEVFIAPIHFRLLVTREDIDRAFIDRIALIAMAGCSSEGA
jgi:hypothetical protein